VNLGIAVHRYDLAEGTGGYVACLLPRLAAVHRVTLYAAQVRAPVPDGVEVVRVPALMARAYTAIVSFPAALRLVRRSHDLFHAQGWVAGSADVVTAHIVMAAWRQAARSARVLTPPGERTLGAWVQAREAALIRRARRVIAPSRKVQDEIARHYGRASGVSVVHHGFPAPPATATRPADRAAARRALGLPDEAIVALFVGDLRKGYPVAAAAVAEHPEVHLAVVSRSPRPPDAEVEAQVRLGARLHWIGPLEDVGPAYVAADFLLHPTIYDAFGLVVAEAMAYGLPPVVTAAAGIAELIQQGQSGWIVEGDVPAGTTTAVGTLARDPDLRARLSAGARAVAASRSWDQVAQETLAIYEEALRGT
jgi:glycosyltransferase involved in cell wall biosynthesis